MPISNEAVTVNQFIEMMKNLDEADRELPLKVRGDHGAYGIYSVRKVESKETDVAHDGDDAKPQKEKYIVING